MIGNNFHFIVVPPSLTLDYLLFHKDTTIFAISQPFLKISCLGREILVFIIHSNNEGGGRS